MGNKVKTQKSSLSEFAIKIIYMSGIVIIATIISILKPATLYVDLFVILVVSSIIIFLCFKEVKDKKYRINDLKEGLNLSLKENLGLLDIPMAIVAQSNKIIWQNEICKHQIPTDYIIDSIINLEKKKQVNEVQEYQLNFGTNGKYKVLGSLVKLGEIESTLLTFIDNSIEEDLIKQQEDTQVSVGILSIDNYEETMQGLDDILKAEITSTIDKELRKWVFENNGIISKLDKDKYVILIEKQYILKMEKESFSILEKIRNITDDTKLPVTISIGMSYSKDTLNARYLAATSSLDIALGRGGDQVVVKKDKNFDFYGGTNIGLEKTSRVRARTISQALKDIIEKSDYVYVMGHKNTDIDCIAGAVGVYKIAKHFGKDASIIVDVKYNASTRMVMDRLKTQEEYQDAFLSKEETKKINFENAVLIVVDTHKKTYVANSDIVDNFEKIVVIDHHRRGPEFIENAMLTYHELYASSTAELVTELLMYMNDIKLTPIEAEAIYSGILVDTKNFTFKTGVRTFEVAAYLKRSGLDITEAKQIFKNDFETYKAKVDIVKNAEFFEEKIAISICDVENDNMPVLAAQAADELLLISGILASFVLCKVENVVMISGRSMGDINVQSILEGMGGGGHLTFAGAQIAGVEIEEAKNLLKANIKSYFGKLTEVDN